MEIKKEISLLLKSHVPDISVFVRALHFCIHNVCKVIKNLNDISEDNMNYYNIAFDIDTKKL